MYNKMEKPNVPVPLSHTELRNLRSDTKSCVEVKTCGHHIILHPFHLSNVAESIKEILNAGVAKYHVEFDGILLGYENVKIFGTEAPMFDDLCYMHQKIEADFYIFKPQVGSILNGIINKKSADHVGCLVHQLFNISLPKPANAQDWLGSKAQIGHEVQFRVNSMKLDARLPYIRGELLTIISEDSGISTSDETAAPKINKIIKFTDEMDGGQSENESGRKKKLEKKKKTVEPDETGQGQEDGATDTSPRKKKSKKEKKLKASDENIEELIEELQGKYQEQLSILKEIAQIDDNVTDQTKQKKKKKHKSHDEEHLDMETSENKSKKKDKKEKKSKKKDRVKGDKKERDLLDQTLPDINLEALFADASQSMQMEPEKDTRFNLDFSLPPDSDMEEILKNVSVDKDKKKAKKSAKKRKLDEGSISVENTESSESKKKKKRKST